MKKLILTVIVLFAVLLLTSCNNNSQPNTEDAAKEVWKVVKAHNKAWAELEDINAQMKYVHEDVVFIKPPFKEIMVGKDKYKADYEEWMLHAKVDYFHEINPVIKVYGNGNFALVSYNIDMAFTYDDAVVNDWKGIDFMTLVKEKGKWLITSDMFARETKQTQ
jgi:ketosteroid isomerase-like protein